MAAIIKVENLNKTFQTKGGQVDALKDISLDIEEGEIYGIIGMSGAGKSTLVRCLNYLERPTSGRVSVDGRDLSALSDKDLRKLRTSIGMIFQSFNLLSQKNVLANVMFPLQITGMPREEAIKRARSLLETVGLPDKEKSYPAQLSGGQCQRVAIARALANDPKIILCDEATSALDPQTTEQILQLLKKINREMRVTIVIITHQMSVVRRICDSVAIIEKGELAEYGSVDEIFAHPKSKAAKRLIIEGKDPDEWEEEGADAEQGTAAEAGADGETAPAADGFLPLEQLHESRRIRIVFSTNSSYEPVIANMILKFGTPVNILKADTKDVGGTARGEMILGLPDDPGVQEQMIAYLQERDLAVQEVEG